MEATEQYFPVVLSIMRFYAVYRVVLSFESVDEILISSDFAVVLFIMLYKVVLLFESVDEILKCDHSNEN